MVPAFLGPRYGVVCEECRRPFFCGADGSLERDFFTCPGCGFAENLVRSARLLPGQRIVIDRLTPGLAREPFQRFDPVVFRNPESPSRWNVKRIAAFPGETVAFQGGNLWINGELYRKTLDEQRKTAIPYQFGRWIDESMDGERRISFDPREPIPHFAPLQPFQRFLPLQTIATAAERRDASFFSPRNPYNQLHFERREETQSLTDEILLTFPKRLLSDKHCEITISTKYETIQVKKADAESLTVRRNGQMFGIASIPAHTLVEISVIDRTFRLGDGQSTLLALPLPNDTDPRSAPETSPVVFTGPAASPDATEFKELLEIRIDPPCADSQNGWIVPENHYFVLGDNTPLSEDSRHWKEPFVPKNMILGIARELQSPWERGRLARIL